MTMIIKLFGSEDLSSKCLINERMTIYAFLIYEEQGTEEERNRVTEKRGVLGTIMNGS